MARSSALYGKAKRHKKRKSRTEVSSDTDSDAESQKAKSSSPEDKIDSQIEGQPMTNTAVFDAFSKYYLAKVTEEFANEIDQLRSADDFNSDSIQLLIGALQQGTSLFSIEEQRLIATAGLSRAPDKHSEKV